MYFFLFVAVEKMICISINNYLEALCMSVFVHLD